MSREAFKRIVEAYHNYDPKRMYEDLVCLHDVSKIIRGRTLVQDQDVQKCDDCSTIKRLGEFMMEIGSGPCDSEQSRAMLNGEAQGQFVVAYRDGDLSNRGGLSGTIEWRGEGAQLLGRTFAVLNAGTHHEPLPHCEECHTVGHAEGWLRAGVVDGDCEGCRVNGAITYHFDLSGETAQFEAVFEGMLICQCGND